MGRGARYGVGLALSGVLLLAGLISLGVAGVMAIDTGFTAAATARADATVTSVDVWDEDEAPDVEVIFQDPDAGATTSYVDWDPDVAAPSEGDHVQIAYDPEYPEDDVFLASEVEAAPSPDEGAAMSVGFTGLGVVVAALVGVGLTVLWARRAPAPVRAQTNFGYQQPWGGPQPYGGAYGPQQPCPQQYPYGPQTPYGQQYPPGAPQQSYPSGAQQPQPYPYGGPPPGYPAPPNQAPAYQAPPNQAPPYPAPPATGQDQPSPYGPQPTSPMPVAPTEPMPAAPAAPTEPMPAAPAPPPRQETPPEQGSEPCGPPAPPGWNVPPS